VRPKGKWEDNIKFTLKKESMKVCMALDWLRIRPRDGFL
jgi:hypothetical protein